MTVSSGPTIGIYGASGFGREVMPLARQQFGHSRLFVFLDDKATDTAVNGHPVYDYATFCGLAGEKAAVIAIADSGIRQRLDKRLASDGIPILGIRSTTTLVGDACDCPSLLSGQGSTLAMVGAYILAGELKEADGNYKTAFSQYENIFKPFIESKQKIAQNFAKSLVPKSKFGIWVRNTFTNLMFLPFVSKLFIRQFMDDKLKLKTY